LKFSDDNKKIIPCAKDDYGIVYNLKGYSVLSIVRSGKLFNFWDRLKNSLEDGKATIFDKPKNAIANEQFTIDEVKSDNNDSSFKSKCKKLFSNLKTKVIKVKIKEQA
jgi:hypothetical protein